MELEISGEKHCGMEQAKEQDKRARDLFHK
jgi:hypothetical protein